MMASGAVWDEVHQVAMCRSMHCGVFAVHACAEEVSENWLARTSFRADLARVTMWADTTIKLQAQIPEAVRGDPFPRVVPREGLHAHGLLGPLSRVHTRRRPFAIALFPLCIGNPDMILYQMHRAAVEAFPITANP